MKIRCNVQRDAPNQTLRTIAGAIARAALCPQTSPPPPPLELVIRVVSVGEVLGMGRNLAEII